MIVTAEGDTVICITQRQMDLMLLYGKVTIDEQRATIRGKDVIIKDMKVQVRQRDSSILYLTAQRDIADKRANTSAELLRGVENTIKKAQRKIRWLQVQRGILGVVIVAETVWLVIKST